MLSTPSKKSITSSTRKNSSQASPQSKKTLSIVVPVYNEESGIPVFLEATEAVLSRCGLNYEIIFIDDGSTDTTADVILHHAEHNPCVKGVLLSRNFGKEAALTCGLEHAQGDAVIPMDVDLQDPPDVIPEMIRKWEAGCEVVLGIRKKRKEGLFKRLTAKLFYKIISAISKTPIAQNSGDFRLMDRVVIEAIAQLPERTRFMRGILSWPGFKTNSVFYNRPPRVVGSTKYSYFKPLGLAFDGIVGFSSLPLRIWSTIGLLIAIGSFIYGGYIGLMALIHGINAVKGITTVAVFLFFLIGLLMIQGGIQGEYIARIFDEVKHRPIYVVRKTTKNLKNTPAHGAVKISQSHRGAHHESRCISTNGE